MSGKQRPFTAYREIRRGRYKGHVAVLLPDGKWVRVEKKAVEQWPMDRGVNADD